MHRTLVGLCFAGLLFGVGAAPAQATEVGYGRNLGLGFELGDPTGFTGKYWVGRTNAIDFGVGFDGYAYGGTCTTNRAGVCNGRLTLNVDYLWQSNLVRSTAQLDWHLGAGGRMNIWNDNARNYLSLGGRMPVGLDLMFNNPNFLELFFELAPVLNIGPSGGPVLWLSFDVDLGIRFYF